MDIDKTSQRIRKPHSNLKNTSNQVERKPHTLLTLTFGPYIPQSLQELRRNFSPKHSQSTIALRPYHQLSSQNPFFPISKIFLKHFSSVFQFWKALTFSTRPKFPKQKSIFIFPDKSETLTRHHSSYLPASPFNEIKRRKIVPSRQKTILKLESSIKFSRSLKKAQKRLKKNCFHLIKACKIPEDLLKILRNLMKSHFSNFFKGLKIIYRIQDLSIVSASPLSITPVPRKSSILTTTQENSLKIESNNLQIHSYIKKNRRLQESGSFDLPNLSSYESLDYSQKLVQNDQFDSLEISNSGFYGQLNDDSLVELEEKEIKQGLSPSLSPLILSKEALSEFAYKSASTASIPHKFSWCNRYSTQSNETISEVSNSRGSINRLPRYEGYKGEVRKSSKKGERHQEGSNFIMKTKRRL